MSAAMIPGVAEVSDAPSPSRRRAWRSLVVVVLIAAIYVAAWFAYTARFAARFDRFVELPVGAPLVTDEADYTILSVVQTPYLVDASKGPVSAAAGTVWVRAEVEALLRKPAADFYCDSPDLLGAQGQRFESESITAYRPDQPSACGPDEIKVGVPYRYEVIYTVPNSRVRAIAGFTLPTFYAGQEAQVARPRA